MIPQWLALLLSIAIEATVGAVFVTALDWGSGLRTALAAALGTLATHWLAWWCMLELIEPLGYATAFVTVEAGVVGAETIVFRALVPLPIGRALMTSLAVNAASAGVGIAVDALNLA